MYLSLTTILSATALLAASFTAAIPSTPPKPCLNATSAQRLVSGYSGLLTNFTKLNANKFLATNFTDTSDSINFLAGIPLGNVTFPSKAAFIAGQGSEPAIGFKVINIDAVTCDTIAFRWEAILGTKAPVKGINIMVGTHSPANGWQIKTNYAEFNSAVWAKEIGGNCTA